MLPDVSKKPDRQLIIKMAGYLEKKGRMRVVGVRRWKKRWCVLEGKLLLYFKTQLEYSHHLSPCRGSVNMGLVLSITPRGPCQLQIVTRSQIIIFRTKSKSEQDEWFAALRDAKNTNQTLIGHYNHRKLSTVETHCRPSHNRMSVVESRFNNHDNGIVQESYRLRGHYGKPMKESYDGIFYEAANGQHSAGRKTSALRKSESDNRISFYREAHGLARSRVATTTAANATAAVAASLVAGGGRGVSDDKESCGRSRSLSYESIYFKPQEKCAPAAAGPASKSQSCRDLAPSDVPRRAPGTPAGGGSVSKRMSRSASFFQRRCCDDSDSDDYDYVEVTSIAAGMARTRPKRMAHIEELEQYPELPPPRLGRNNEEIVSTTSTSVAQSGNFDDDLEADVDVIYYVNNDRKINMFTNEPKSDLVLEYGTERTVEAEDEPPPLPIKTKSKQNTLTEKKKNYQIIDGVYVFEDGTKEVIYDVPIPHGKLIEHFRRLSVAPVSPVKRYADIIYDDSLEPSIYETLHMTPDSLEIATMFPTYKRWSNDSGFNNYEEPNSFSPDRTHFEDSLEPVIAMIHRDRKIWQNVPNINSTDYFR